MEDILDEFIEIIIKYYSAYYKAQPIEIAKAGIMQDFNELQDENKRLRVENAQNYSASVANSNLIDSMGKEYQELLGENTQLRNALWGLFPGLDDYWMELPNGMIAVERSKIILNKERK